jgi:ubiquinone/menaquinone biosynthesis C-methylase UbiE
MKEWDEYWLKAPKTYNRVYDRVAVFYRKYIIKPYLKRYFSCYFPSNSVILHAGCGGGQVEEGIMDTGSIIGLDISMNALSLYKKNHLVSNLILGNLMITGFKDESLDGIYNLGVMEHFSEDEIHQILLEFRRILKKKGTIILFWPPRYGATVIFLKGIHFFYNSVLGKNVRLHPPEPSLVENRNHVETIVNQAGFRMLSYNFGIEDLFTYAVIVLKPAE